MIHEHLLLLIQKASLVIFHDFGVSSLSKFRTQQLDFRIKPQENLTKRRGLILIWWYMMFKEMLLRDVEKFKDVAIWVPRILQSLVSTRWKNLCNGFLELWICVKLLEDFCWTLIRLHLMFQVSLAEYSYLSIHCYPVIPTSHSQMHTTLTQIEASETSSHHPQSHQKS